MPGDSCGYSATGRDFGLKQSHTNLYNVSRGERRASLRLWVWLEYILRMVKPIRVHPRDKSILRRIIVVPSKFQISNRCPRKDFFGRGLPDAPSVRVRRYPPATVVVGIQENPKKKKKKKNPVRTMRVHWDLFIRRHCIPENSPPETLGPGEPRKYRMSTVSIFGRKHPELRIPSTGFGGRNAGTFEIAVARQPIWFRKPAANLKSRCPRTRQNAY